MAKETHVIRWSNGDITQVSREKDSKGKLNDYAYTHTLTPQEVKAIYDVTHVVDAFASPIPFGIADAVNPNDTDETGAEYWNRH